VCAWYRGRVAPRAGPSKSPAREKSSKRSRVKPADGPVAPYTAYAIAKDGSRRRIPDAYKLVIDIGPSEVQIDLAVSHGVVKGQVHVQVWGKHGARLLVLGPGDGGSVWVDSAERFGDRLKLQSQ
jgi:hypothetical protein